MEGLITSYRRGRHTQNPRQMVVKVDSLDSKEKAEKLLGKKVSYDTGKKEIKGEVSAAHGNSGAVRVLFETGMPGQAIGKKVKIN